MERLYPMKYPMKAGDTGFNTYTRYSPRHRQPCGVDEKPYIGVKIPRWKTEAMVFMNPSMFLQVSMLAFSIFYLYLLLL